MSEPFRPGGFSVTDIHFWDGKPNSQPDFDIFEGNAIIIGGTGALGPGFTVGGHLVLNGNDIRTTGPTKGFDLSLDVFFDGESVKNYEYTECCP